ncbi:putative long-chain base protein 3 protein [Botrytis fragariae]|uniref:Putative long-chain base protein 3 protein n=1 Tax=Botrytis fragariae TaxID=1964551 RepID=A0A8H6EEC1_9HELO|nr:putative long-chain base protein 3 protein [Botrytis fragariae]KAF5869071.1 putative long-chain base protein 3 protein [Botrytis fragariae]
MCPTPNGDGLELEKSNNNNTQPPSISLTVPPTEIIDAGLKSLNHYKRKLPPWRYNMRQALLPLVRWETPYLAWMQDKMRCPALDTYFAVTANLGTHTFFMVVLPILFWCGHTSLGRGMVHILATGVFITGFIKDMFSLPRPLSPPLHRITMSGSAALEYGFPSTHSANAVSVAVYALFTLHSPECQLLPSTKLALEIVSYSYAFSIVLGRLYCGMHGFVDVIVGSVIGALISVVECVYGSAIDNYLHSSTWKAPVTIAIVIILLIRVHPEPADDCPCFDDSVAFAAVMIGVELGGWHYASGGWAWDVPVPATVPFDLHHMGWVIVILRVLIGVLVIFAWREVMKPTLLKLLPHIFRAFENTGLILPRKFFMPASEYNNIPSRLKVDNVMPSVSDLPSLISSIRHAGRGRAVSVGPQSAADAYETLAYREKRRRDSLTDVFEGMTPRQTATKEAKDYFGSRQPTMDGAVSSGMSSIHGSMNLPTPAQSRVGSYEQMMGAGHVMYTPGVSTPGLEGDDAAEDEITVGQENELDETEMFSRLEKPRVRYDVEVVTKLVVYSGIAWLAVEGNPIIFEVIGLGMGV